MEKLDISEFMVIWSFVVISCLIVICGLLYYDIRRVIELRSDWLLDMHRQDMEAHQNWLFNQLYSMAPGKVLRPEELAPKDEGEPAFVYSPTEDGMAEFTGDRDDWR